MNNGASCLQLILKLEDLGKELLTGSLERSYLYYFCNFYINLRLFQNKNFVRRV